MKEKIIIFDTTLRDGEQAPGASLTFEQKLELAIQLERLGVDVIEAGFPVASPGDFKAVETIAGSIKKSIICGLARCLSKDIETAAKALHKARNPRMHIFLATSKIHLKYKFRKAEDEILALATRATRKARKLCPDIEFSPEDATRSDRKFLFKVIETVIAQGAKTVNIPDTVGYSYPQEMYSLIADIRDNVPNINKAVISVHCHDDLGLAAANSLSGILAGARQVHCTVNGIGERAGNASLEEIAMVVKTRKDSFKNIFTSINTKEIFRTSRLVSSLTGFVVPPNKAIVGKNAFAHESGIHQDAVLKKRNTYEIMNPKDVGIDKSQIVLGKHSGRHALAKRLEKLGFIFSDKKVNTIFKKFKILADKKKEVFDDDLIALAEEETKPLEKKCEFVSIKSITGTDIVPEAAVTLRYKNKVVTASSSGDGPIDACYRAIDKLVGVKAKLISYKLEALTIGKDAQGLVRVELKINKDNVFGRGASTDVLEASAKAYLDALNKKI
ncbi:MAG: 2-isopropylmalate synthase [Candidatus Omnitrophica bacterium]|nr:2-isopropylmalate synthase [Candidatus Omnitrophota bacterium]MDD5430024.1 2-isopropylmalate synthase [Candidatus Omnitrophota bacterium]